MAIARFKKLQLVAHNTLHKTLLEELQQIGGVHIVDWRESDFPEDDEKEERTATLTHAVTSEVDAALSKVDYCLKFIMPYEEPIGFMEKLSQSRPVVDLAQLKKLEAAFGLNQVYEQCRDLEHQFQELYQRIQQFQTQIADIRPWTNINVPLEDLRETDTTFIYTLKICQEESEAFKQKLAEQLGGQSVLTEAGREGESLYLVLVLLREKKPCLETLMVDFEVEQVKLPPDPLTPRRLVQNTQKELAETEQKLKRIQQEGKSFLQHKNTLELLHDYYYNQKKQAEVQESLYKTSHTVVLEGWVVQSKVSALNKRLNKNFKEIHITLRDPEEGEVPPVQLVNNGIIRPFEAVTNLYGFPHPGELDPTPLLAPFFFIFFGLCLTDAGYGILMMLMTFWGLRAMVLPDGTKKMFQLLFLSGLATLIAGAITGSWFGDIIDLLPASMLPLKNLKDSLILFDPIKEPVTFMIISLILGYIQVCCGIAIEMYDKIKHKEWAEAFLKQFPWLVLFFGLGIMGVEGMIGGDTIVLIRKALVYSGVGALVILSPYDVKNPVKRLGLGLLELYNLVAYGSDILSYSRLLALGLATGVIGTVVNKIALLTIGIPGVGYILMALIMVGGHLFNLAINALGAFVHTSRLQFVEFFPKFFEGGGKAFQPFSWEGKYSIYSEKEAL